MSIRSRVSQWRSHRGRPGMAARAAAAARVMSPEPVIRNRANQLDRTLRGFHQARAQQARARGRSPR